MYEADEKPAKLTQARLEKLRETIPHATIQGIGAKPGPEATQEFLDDLAEYLRHFVEPKRDDGEPCVGCGEPLAGDLAQQLFGRGGFTWGLAHGHGHCKRCGWPATMYHFIKDRHGEDLVTIRNILLQQHPDDIERFAVKVD